MARQLSENTKIDLDQKEILSSLRIYGDLASILLFIVAGQKEGAFLKIEDKRERVIEAVRQKKTVESILEDPKEVKAMGGKEKVENLLKVREEKLLDAFFQNASVYEASEYKGSYIYKHLVLQEPNEKKPESYLQVVRFNYNGNSRFWKQPGSHSWYISKGRTVESDENDGTSNNYRMFVVLTRPGFDPSKPFCIKVEEDREDGKRFEKLIEVNSAIKIKEKVLQEVTTAKSSKKK